jgi:hypothetical protein
MTKIIENLADSDALDLLAAYLRDTDDWNGGDFCEMAAFLIEQTGRKLGDDNG